jgi:hypothetical protein
MRGEVEIYEGDELIHKESNLIMDGASQLMADIMTISPSVSALGEDTTLATKAILDASNYRIAAISFGTAEQSYQQNAHEYTEDKAALLSGTSGAKFRGASAVCAFMRHGGDGIKQSGAALNYAMVSSYDPVPALTSPPNPAMSSLEMGSDVSAVLSTYILSSYVAGNGQNLNLVPREYHYNHFNNTDLASYSSVAASFLGCWPEGSGAGGTQFSGFSGSNYLPGDVAYSGVYKGIFNEAESMDTSGFVNMVMSSVPHGGNAAAQGYELSSSYSGLTVSASLDNRNSGESWSSTGEVVYEVMVGSGDVGLSNFYGGIYNMGLWTIDMKKTLQEGNTPPYLFDPLNNPRKYRLFSTKSLTENLGYARTVESASAKTYAGVAHYRDLKLKWKLYFK